MSTLNAPAALLAELVAFPTQQAGPDRGAGDELAMCRHLAPRLERAGATVEIFPVVRGSGEPGAYLLARWGTPRLLINAHVDTVPANRGWSQDPWTPKLVGDRLYGLGTADTKGAIAAAVIAAERSHPEDLGLLFSGDEEHGTACVTAFLASSVARDVEYAVVCEPTARRAGLAHRGVIASRATLRGSGGHSSKADHLPRPIPQLARLAVALDELGRARLHDGPADMKGLCLNVAGLSGGVAFNVVPSQAELTWSLRPWPGFHAQAWHQEVAELARAIDPLIELSSVIDHQPFRCERPAPLTQLLAGHVHEFGPLDFWTEAALYAERGIHAVVVGPGDIAQAHTADEWVALDDLDWAVRLFTDLITRPRPAP
ncbi:MAG: M20/M25/M40 family metallo-hydrolase [Myxococcales bacterium]|nr:M20/M25/M40 family metallo-hydrolase [Myxococcales bacterium]